MAASTTSAEDKQKLEGFGTSDKWDKHFVAGNGLTSYYLHGESGSVDSERTEEGMKDVREECKKIRLGEHL